MESLQKMLGFSPDQNQTNMFSPLLKDFINMGHELVALAEKIDWKYFEEGFSDLYSRTGQPAKPIRKMTGLLLLKRLYNLSDEKVCEAWIRDPYMQYFCGEAHFQWEQPCDPSDLVHFRHRLGEAGVEKILSYSVKMHGKKAESHQVLMDTTVQEKNIAYPTDAGLAKKVIDHCNRIAEKEGIKQRQTYKRVSKKLVRAAYFGHHPRRLKPARRAIRKLRTIAGRLVRELERKLETDKYAERLALFRKVISQRRNSKDKVYSLHEPEVSCIAKGKAHKKYEFGCKVSITLNPKELVILGVKTFSGNPYDGDTIAPSLEQTESLLAYRPEEVVYDRGGRGRKNIDGTQIATPTKPSAKDSVYVRRKKRKKHRRRSAIEPIIGHLKSSYRMGRNYLGGRKGDQINAMMAAAGWNFKKWMEKIPSNLKNLLFPKIQFLFLKPSILTS